MVVQALRSTIVTGRLCLRELETHLLIEAHAVCVKLVFVSRFGLDSSEGHFEPENNPSFSFAVSITTC